MIYHFDIDPKKCFWPKIRNTRVKYIVVEHNLEIRPGQYKIFFPSYYDNGEMKEEINDIQFVVPTDGKREYEIEL